MSNFEFFGVAKIVFGRGRVARLGEIAAGFGKRALLVYNGGDARDETSPPGRASVSLRSAGGAVVAVRQRGEPTTDDVDSAVLAARDAGCDVVIAVGGGSAIDAGKAVAGLLANGGSALDYMEVVGLGRKLHAPAVPWIAVPTTAGSGAEATRNAVIGFPAKKFKASLRSELLLPRVAVIDPELGEGVPPAVSARSGMDALCQLIEAYASTGAQPMTDAFTLQGIPLAAWALPKVVADGADAEARGAMAWAALLSGMALTNAGLGSVHGFAAPLGAIYPAPHGSICAALLAPALRANVAGARSRDDAASRRALARYADVGRLLAGACADDADAIDRGLDRLSELARSLAIPGLGSFGIKSEDVPGLVELARKSSSMKFNPVELTDAELAAAVRAGL